MNLHKTIFYIDSQYQSEATQKALFDLGYYWSVEDRNVRETTIGGYIRVGGDDLLSHGPDNFKSTWADYTQLTLEYLLAQKEIVDSSPEQKPHSHYYKDVSALSYIDVYRTLSLFNVTDPCLQHAIKKLLVAGGRGAGKDIAQDVQEAIDSLQRWKEMKAEDEK